jgi:uncharacterized membrane protein YgcG
MKRKISPGKFIMPLIVLAFFGYGIYETVTTPYPDTQVDEAQEEITAYDVVIRLSPDATAEVTETITYDFKENSKHGIYRTIPLTRGAGTTGELVLSGLEVSSDYAGEDTLYSSEGFGRKVTQPNLVFESLFGSGFESLFGPAQDSVSVKIGDPDAYVTGTHVYTISYTAERAVGYFSDRDEFYWNVTGNAWEVPITSAQVTLVLPTYIPVEQLHLASYCGLSGAKAPCSEPVVGVEEETGRTTVSYTMPREPELFTTIGRGMTIAVGFPRGIVAVVGTIPPPWMKYLGYWYLFVPFLVGPLVYRKRIAYLLSRHQYYKTTPIIPEYDAGTLTPLEAGVLVRGAPKDEDLSAELIWLAIAGYIRIVKNGDNNYDFIDTGKDRSELSTFNKALLDGVAGKSSFYLMNSFYVTANLIKKDIIASLTQKGFLEKSSKSSSPRTQLPSHKGGVIFICLFLAVNPGLFIWILFGVKFGAAFSLSMVMLALLAFIFGSGARLTRAGLEKERMLMGLKEYIDAAEDERIKFHNAPAKSPEVFEKLLPFAMIFGLEKEWAKEFEGVYTTPPNWYTDAYGVSTFSHSFTALNFATDLSSFASQATSALTSAPAGSGGGSSGSSGGGSSGGGGGGGGGGSW